MTWLDMQVAREINKERVEDGIRYAQYKAEYLGDVPQPRRFNPVAAFARLFQGRKPDQVNAPETQTQRRTA